MEHYEVIDGGGSNPYHLLFYMISNFLIANTEKEIEYYYPYKDCRLENEFLALLPPNFRRVCTKRPGVHYTTFMHAIPIFEDTALPESYKLLRKLYAPLIAPSFQKGSRIYIARDIGKIESRKRTFENETEVQEAMRMAGFKIVTMEDHSVMDQIRIISSAEVVVGAHGAGLAFTVFCAAGAKVVEIFRPVDKPKRHYMHIAHCCGLQFHRFSEVQTLDEHENMNVNVHALFSLLMQIS